MQDHCYSSLTFNPYAQDNFVTGANVRVLLQTNSSTDDVAKEYELFNTKSYISLGNIDDDSYKTLNGYRLIKNLERKYFQKVVLTNVSDSTWEISPPAQQEIYDIVSNGIKGNSTVNIVLKYSFERPYPEGQQNVEKELPYFNIFRNDSLYNKTIVDTLNTTLNPERQ